MPTERSERLEIWDSAASPLVTPSLLNCDFAQVGRVLEAMAAGGVVAAHLDVMDGHFVPNLSYGPPVIADWRKVSDLPFESHLMIERPEAVIEDYARAGSDSIVIHVEAAADPGGTLKAIQALGCRAGLALNPETPVDAVETFLDQADSILVMSVHPGFGGQAFIPEVLEKVRRLRARAARPDLRISIDGGINASTADRAVGAGATQLVVGSASYRADGMFEAATLASVAEAARRGTQRGESPSDRSGASSTA